MIRIIGPRDPRVPGAINTTSHSAADWSQGLSPFALGPVQLYDGMTARIMENAWQFSKLYPEHTDSNGDPTQMYWNWARAGWSSTYPRRYPMGKGRKPLCSLWNGEKLLYIEARKRIYLPLYRDAVIRTKAYRKLKEIYRERGAVSLFDFDGYNYHRLGMSLGEVLTCPTRIMGHSFVLAMCLLFGDDFKVADVIAGKLPPS